MTGRSAHACRAALLLAVLSSGQARGEKEIYRVPAPERQRYTGTGQADEAPRSLSRTTGDPVVSIPLDNTGVADWRFLNPRNPQRVPPNHSVEFTNLTDRTFEVTTSVALRPAELVPRPFPATVPLIVYDALTIGERRPDFGETETLGAYELRLIGSAKAANPDFTDILEHVLELEKALRDRAASVAVLNEARAKLVGMKLESLGTLVAPLETALAEAEAAKILADDRIAALTGTLTADPRDDLGERRKPLIALLAKRIDAKGKERIMIGAGETRDRIDAEISLLSAAIDALRTQSEDSALTARLRRAIPSLRLDECTVAATVTCSASLLVYPNGSAQFPHEVLLYQADLSGPARFRAKFYEEADTPAFEVAYLIAAELAGRSGPPKSAGIITAIASVGGAVDRFVEDRSATSRNCPFLCPDKPHTGDRRTHYSGAGRVEVTQSFGNLLDGKVSLSFKEGDLGGGNASTEVKLLQYRFNIYSEPGWTFHYGKYTFAAPSSGIALNETGEGFRLGYHNYAVAHLVKRESALNVADAANRDSKVWIAEANNMTLRTRFLRTLSVVYLAGEDQRQPEKKKNPNTGVEETFFSGHTYQTYGGQVGFAIPRYLYGSLAAYASRRDADEAGAPCGESLHVCDGHGHVSLLTITRPFSIDDQGRPRRILTLTMGQGSGDDPSTSTDDEGYIGETAAYVPDQIFLASLAGAVSSRDFVDVKLFADPSNADNDKALKEQFHGLDVGPLGIGRGLANKQYASVKYVDNHWSLLELLAVRLLKVPEADIRSRATVVTLHEYRLRTPFFGSRQAGNELDIEFQVETPRAVKTTLKLGYYAPGAALREVIRKDVWGVSAGMSISL